MCAASASAGPAPARSRQSMWRHNLHLQNISKHAQLIFLRSLCLPQDEETLAAAAAGGDKASKGGFLSTFVRSLGVSVVGTGALTAEDVAPALEALRRKLMERNVASEIADK